MKTISKTIQKSISKSKYVLLALLVAFSVSCSPEDGETGPQGPAGTDGTDGIDGVDGNANVQTFIFDTSSNSGSLITLPIPEITQDVLDNDVILSYYTSDMGVNYQMPGGGSNGAFVTRTYANPESFSIRFTNWDGSSYSVAAGSIEKVKIIIIESTSTTTGRTISSKQQIYNELNQAGVNINDYHAVCDYYGIPY